jgi:integrase
MGRFRSSKSQAKHAVIQKLAVGKPRHGKKEGDTKIHSLGSARTYRESLSCLAEYISERKLDPNGSGLTGLNKNLALDYLEYRSHVVGQKQLDKDRQAIQIMVDEKLVVIKSDIDQVLKSRAYTPLQIELVAESQTPKNSLATRIAADAGLRAHELHTIAPIELRNGPSEHREWAEERFSGRRNMKRYTVIGKGGLVREVTISIELSQRLELLRFAEPQTVTDREIFYTKYYDIGGGHKWSDSFSKASQRRLGWTSGGHGLRHTYAQSRMEALQSLGKSYFEALGIVSQEMGHFREEITQIYLR